VDELYSELNEFPSIQLGIETAFRSFYSTDLFSIFPSEFLNGSGIIINGLIWMGDISYMKDQIDKKINDGFKCIKLKIGAIDFKDELALLRSIRDEYSSNELELRVDANGAFVYSEALEKLKQLSDYDIHSIEQPIKQGQWQEMARICEDSPLDIALDEELIGVLSEDEKIRMLNTINPQYIILKPSLIGGFAGSDSWLELAGSRDIGWWITSALESNIGLNAISQYTFIKNCKLPQGLGTGELFNNNFTSPLLVRNGTIQYDTNRSWDVDQLMK
jgi:L-alanine-DL-glutamate epimerase-like enolase superfamily enzyme